MMMKSSIFLFLLLCQMAVGQDSYAPVHVDRGVTEAFISRCENVPISLNPSVEPLDHILDTLHNVRLSRRHTLWCIMPGLDYRAYTGWRTVFFCRRRHQNPLSLDALPRIDGNHSGDRRDEIRTVLKLCGVEELLEIIPDADGQISPQAVWEAVLVFRFMPTYVPQWMPEWYVDGRPNLVWDEHDPIILEYAEERTLYIEALRKYFTENDCWPTVVRTSGQDYQARYYYWQNFNTGLMRCEVDLTVEWNRVRVTDFRETLVIESDMECMI